MLEAITKGAAVGTALLAAVSEHLRASGVEALCVTTTNDNLDAHRFYQRRGFRLRALRPGAVDEARHVKRTISTAGNYGIPIRDELDLELDLRTP